MFIDDAPETPAVRVMYDADRDDDGYVANSTRVWSWRPDVLDAFVSMRTQLLGQSSLTDAEKATVVAATVGAFNCSYCSLAWGGRLAALTDDETAAQVLVGADAPAASPREAALAEWARAVVRHPNGTTGADVAKLRAVGLDDREIFEATALVGFRLAFSTINDALGAAPDLQLAEATPPPIRAAVTYGRPPAARPSSA